MKCKFCDMDGLKWPEEYKPGDRPLEPETNIPHTFERCNNIKYPTTGGWDKRRCIKCNVSIWWNRNCKMYDTIKNLNICTACNNTVIN